MVLCKRKGDLRKCIPIYAAGGAFLICGLPLMITGIAGTFNGADLVGYIGGICIFFGLGFFLMWHMFTIDNVEKNISAVDYDPSLNTVQDIIEKSRTTEMNQGPGRKYEIDGSVNMAYVGNVRESGAGGTHGTLTQTENKSAIDSNYIPAVTGGNCGIEESTVGLNTNSSPPTTASDVVEESSLRASSFPPEVV